MASVRQEFAVLLAIKLTAVIGVLAALLYAFGRFIHQSLYEAEPSGMAWRGPAAGGVVGATTLLLPMLVNGSAGSRVWPITFNDVFISDTKQDQTQAIEFVAFRVKRSDGLEEEYRKKISFRGVAQVVQYLNEANQALPATTPTMLGVTKSGEQIELQLEAGGNRYRTADGRFMSPEGFGRLTQPAAWGRFFFNLFAGFIAMLVWVIVCVALLQFQPGHALLFGIPLALVWSFVLNFVFPA